MKKLLLVALMCVSTLAHGQKKFKDKDQKIGVFMSVGGVALTIGAAFTPTEYQFVHGTYYTQQSPIYKQSARLGGIVAGCAFTLSGGITALLTMEKGNKKHRR